MWNQKNSHDEPMQLEFQAVSKLLGFAVGSGSRRQRKVSRMKIIEKQGRNICGQWIRPFSR
jgi:hypothetical protein